VGSSSNESQDAEARWNAENPTLASFVIRLQVYAARDPDKSGRWRGTVTHVADGERIPIHDVGQIIPFVASYLEDLGVRHSLRTRLICRLYRSKERRNAGDD
jgi:hypothetical protein